MKKIFFIFLIYFFTLTNFSFSQSMLSLEKYLEWNENQLQDPTVLMYLSDRCSGLNLYQATILSTSTSPEGLEAAERFKEMCGIFFLTSYKILISEFNKVKDQAQEIVKESMIKKYEDYLKDGKDLHSKTGSYFIGNYIESDMKVCEQLSKITLE